MEGWGGSPEKNEKKGRIVWEGGEGKVGACIRSCLQMQDIVIARIRVCIYVTKATCSAANQHPSCVFVTVLYQWNLSLMEYISLFFLLADRENQSILITYVLSRLLAQNTISLSTNIAQIDRVSHTTSNNCQ